MAISAISSGIAGMQQAAARFEGSAGRIARAGTGLGEVDVTSEMVNVLQSKFEFEAATKVVRVASDMEKWAIDILA
ncbi:flagellar basal body rod C-terminal domain-containing protein [uncultured Devosia sp.]|uniref:flagellar basal body rod C-terminal domain-containing protein n=1 Tax=uncultured Devosia sp. TaxID=211434 RepID=UPI0035CC38ED